MVQALPERGHSRSVGARHLGIVGCVRRRIGREQLDHAARLHPVGNVDDVGDHPVGRRLGLDARDQLAGRRAHDLDLDAGEALRKSA